MDYENLEQHMNQKQRERALKVHDRWEAWAEDFELSVGMNAKLAGSQLGQNLLTYMSDMRRHRNELLVHALTVGAAARAAYQLYRDARMLREFALRCMAH